MVYTSEEEEYLSKMKHALKLEFETVRHTNKMKELEKEIEYAKIIGGDLNGSGRTVEYRDSSDEKG